MTRSSYVAGQVGRHPSGIPRHDQDADLYVERSPGNGAALVAAIRELGFALSKAATNPVKDRESLPRLRAFRDYWASRRRG